MKSFWKILRILTTNQCNYRCLYCHNEGQDKEQCVETLSFEDFRRIISIIDGMGFQEIRFSGGEPLVNPMTIEMIEWLNNNSNYEIGLATNGSLITDKIAKRLGKTRVLLTLHYPAVSESEYSRITGKTRMEFENAVNLLDKYQVNHSFNFVLYPETINNINDVIEDVISKAKRVKLLPYIEEGFRNYSEGIVEKVREKLDLIALSKEVYLEGGITTWYFENGGKVKLLDSPCYDHSINRCRNYGELRLLPDLSFQKCIFDTKSFSIKDKDDDEIRTSIDILWETFNKCL